MAATLCGLEGNRRPTCRFGVTLATRHRLSGLYAPMGSTANVWEMNTPYKLYLYFVIQHDVAQQAHNKSKESWVEFGQHSSAVVLRVDRGQDTAACSVITSGRRPGLSASAAAAARAGVMCCGVNESTRTRRTCDFDVIIPRRTTTTILHATTHRDICRCVLSWALWRVRVCRNKSSHLPFGIRFQNMVSVLVCC